MPARFRLTAAVAEYAEILRQSYWARESSMVEVLELARQAAAELPNDPDGAEFVSLVQQANRLAQSQ
jgi:Ca-activated chloride channel family protein